MYPSTLAYIQRIIMCAVGINIYKMCLVWTTDHESLKSRESMCESCWRGMQGGRYSIIGAHPYGEVAWIYSQKVMIKYHDGYVSNLPINLWKPFQYVGTSEYNILSPKILKSKAYSLLRGKSFTRNITNIRVTEKSLGIFYLGRRRP